MKVVILGFFLLAVFGTSAADKSCLTNVAECADCENTTSCKVCKEGFGISANKRTCHPDECQSITGKVSDVCQEFRLTVHDAINAQVNEELVASYIYMDMAQFFDRADIAYPGCAKFFRKAADEERDHAQKLIDYINKRGGTVQLKAIQAPDWEKEKIGGLVSKVNSPYHAVSKALDKEREVNALLLNLHKVARTYKDDPHLQDFLEGEFLTEQVDSIKELSDWKTILKRMENDPVGIMMFDRELADGKRG